MLLLFVLLVLQPFVFWAWIFAALIESIIISVLPLFTLVNASKDSGNTESFLMAGMTAFTVIVLVVNFKVMENIYVFFVVTVHLYIFPLTSIYSICLHSYFSCSRSGTILII